MSDVTITTRFQQNDPDMKRGLVCVGQLGMTIVQSLGGATLLDTTSAILAS